MGWRGVVWALAACLMLGGRAGATELRRIDVTPTPEGAAVELVCSGTVRPAIRAFGDRTGTVSRLYVDLPRGTRLATGVARLMSAVPPVAALRVGVGEAGVLRVVIDLDRPATYEVLRGKGLRVALAAGPAVALAPPPAAAAMPVPAKPFDPQSLSRPKIVLDPGHGGQDPGARAFAVEKHVTLAIAKQLATLLEERLGATVVLTRAGDTTLPLAARTARANTEGADLFLSIHANASPSRRLNGVETYYLKNTNDRATIRLAAMENGLDLLTRARSRTSGRPDLRYILSDLVQVGKMEESIALAAAVQRGLVGHLNARYGGVADLGVKQGPFYVLVGAYMPCVLVETSFLTHPGEGRRLASPAYRQAVAEGIYAGVARFLADTRRARTL